MPKTRNGFTLIEVLVALVIFAVMAGGFMSYAGQRVQRSAYLADKTLATIVASNTITEMQLGGVLPEAGQTTQYASMAEKSWQLDIDVQETKLPELRRLEINVTSADSAPGADAVSVTLVGFVGKH